VADLALAVDIGGTKMAAGLVALDGTLVERAMRPTPATASPDEAEVLWDNLAGVVGEMTAAVRPGDHLVVCGAGCGGPMSPGGEEVSPLNIAGWRSFPLRARLAALTGLPTFVDNDAKALALGEGWVGAAAGHDDYLAMVVSTGVGGGIVLDGRLLDGRLGNAGHIGHVVVVPDGRHCPCGAAAVSRRRRRVRPSRP
jgi:glucokinase